MTVLDINQTAVVFPGQGSQTPGCEPSWPRFAPICSMRPDELVGADPFSRVAQSTRFAQPAILMADAGPGRVLSRLSARCITGASAGTAESLLEDISAPV